MLLVSYVLKNCPIRAAIRGIYGGRRASEEIETLDEIMQARERYSIDKFFLLIYFSATMVPVVDLNLDDIHTLSQTKVFKNQVSVIDATFDDRHDELPKGFLFYSALINEINRFHCGSCLL